MDNLGQFGADPTSKMELWWDKGDLLGEDTTNFALPVDKGKELQKIRWRQNDQMYKDSSVACVGHKAWAPEEYKGRSQKALREASNAKKSQNCGHCPYLP